MEDMWKKVLHINNDPSIVSTEASTEASTITSTSPPIAGLGLVDLLKGKEQLIGAEIGVSWAQTSEYLLQNLDIRWYYCIDPWQPYEGANSGAIFPNRDEADRHYKIAMEKLKPFKDKVMVLGMTSKEAARLVPNETLDFVFLDGNHSYEFVKEDQDLWWPKVRPGGVFAGHDWTYFDVKPAVRSFFKKDPDRIKITCNDMWYVIKDS